jgi:hypothetical protein
MNWNLELGRAQLVKLAVARADVTGLWPSHPPRPAASSSEIEAVSMRLGFALDEQLAEFLRHADGWPAALHRIDIFGCDDFGQGPRWERANELLDSIELPKHERCPFAVSEDDIDVFCIRDGKVQWFAGHLIEEFASFEAFFLELVELNREEELSLREAGDAL